MREVVLALLICLLFPSENAFADYCAKPDKALEIAPQLVGNESNSSFRGIGLFSPPDNVRWRAQSLGFETVTSFFVGGGISEIIIGIDGNEFGRADFDRTGRMLRLSLKQKFFGKPLFVRKFADDLFEDYAVRPTKVVDDVCFQDVTCFRGVSKYGEQFLILRIGTEAELFVSPMSSLPEGN